MSQGLIAEFNNYSFNIESLVNTPI